MRISDWSSDVCSSDLVRVHRHPAAQPSVRIVLLAQSCQRTRTSDTVLGRVKPQCKLKPRRDRGMARMPLARLHRSLQIAQIKALDIAPDHPCRMLRSKQAVQVDSRSEEHTSELQSLMRNSYAVFCLNKKTTN